MAKIKERIDARVIVDELLDRTARNAALIAAPGVTTVKVGDLGEGRELVVENCRFTQRLRVGERLLTGRRTTQPVVVLIENNGARVVTPLPNAEDILKLPTSLSARVVDCLRELKDREIA